MKPTATALQFIAVSRFGSWLLLAAILVTVVAGSLFWLHYNQRQMLEQATWRLSEFRQAQIDLTNGFLQINLSEAAKSPFSRQNGLALIEQAVIAFDHAIVETTPVPLAMSAAFKDKANAFMEQLQGWQQASNNNAKQLQVLRLQFADLSRQAYRLDRDTNSQLHQFSRHNDQVFSVAFSGSLLALMLLIAILFKAMQCQKKALDQQSKSLEAIRQSEARLRHLFDDAPIAMGVLRSDGRVEAINKRFVEMFGFALSDITTFDEWCEKAYPDPIYRKQVRSKWDLALDSVRNNRGLMDAVEFQIVSRGGQKRIVQITGILLDDTVLSAFFDVTELRSAEQQLQLWHQAFEQAQMGLVISDATDNTIVSINPAFARERGYEPAELIGMPLAQLFAPEHKTDVRKMIDVLDKTSHGVFETEHVCKDGRRFPVLADITVLRDADGMPLNRFAYVLDLTANKQAEKALAETRELAVKQEAAFRLALLNQMQDANTARQNAENALVSLAEHQARLKLFIDYAPASLAMFDRDMRYLAFSRRWLDDYGLAGRDLTGLSHYAVFPEIGEEWKAVHRRAMNGEIIRTEEDRFERADGSVQWLRWEVRPWFGTHEQVGGIVVFSEDISARVEAVRSLATNEARMRVFIDTIPDLVWIKDAEGRFLLINMGIERLLDKPQQAILGHSDYDFFDKSVADDFRANDLRALASEMPVINEDWLEFADDGYRGLFQTIKAKVGDVDGNVIGVLGIARDITALRRAEDELRAVNAELEQRVAERTAELQTLNQSLESFVYSVSHDLKAPLRGIDGYSQLLQEDYGDSLQGDGRHFIGSIRNGVVRMGELIDDLLAYSRMERRRLDFQRVDVSSLVSELLTESAEDIASRGVEIDNRVASCFVRGDRQGLLIALRNLLQNALKFSAQAAMPYIEITCRAEADWDIIKIADNGIGFDMMYHDRIFEIFQRLHRLEDYPGTGIGLALVKKAMQRMGGEVRAESAPGKGAAFYLKLPVGLNNALT